MKEVVVVVRGDILAGRFGLCSSCWGGTVDVYVNYGGEGEEGEEGEEEGGGKRRSRCRCKRAQ